ncbi:hypothetical protein BKA65DRAFT_490000 [Rhexocercosporidium sp. MPI-PUGE-AT-0058]|nr:hypothetical protein BKA65DRAFT_490000 [Rhexocercosporidium sp. MPI-PUGE-AT-0058]
MPLVSRSLAFKQEFSNLGVETSAQAKLNEATTAYDKAELTKSAELFLESWRILRNEYESSLFTPRDSSLSLKAQIHQEKSLARENQGRLLLSLFALHDLARACSRVHGEYKDNAGKCKLDVYALRYGWKGNTTTEALEVEADGEGDDGIKPPWPEGSGIAHVLLLKDPLGRLLEDADSFKEAAIVIANLCSLQFSSLSGSLQEHREGCDFISDSLLWIRRRASFEIASTKAARNGRQFEQIQEEGSENSEEEKARKKLIFKMNDGKSKGAVDKEEEELSDLINQLHVTSLPDQLIHQLERFHVTEEASRWPYRGKSFEHTQEKKNLLDEEDDEDN